MLEQTRTDNVEARWKRLGDMLLDAGLITPGQLEEGLAEKERHKCFLGQALVMLGYLTQDELISFLVKQCKIPHINLVDYTIDPRIARLLPADLCHKYKLIPIDNLGNILTVAMVNPLDIDALEHARAVCPDLKIKPILCTPEHFETVARRLLVTPDDSGKPAEEPPLSLASFGLSAAVAKVAAITGITPPGANVPEVQVPGRLPGLDMEDVSVLVREILGELLSMFPGAASELSTPAPPHFVDGAHGEDFSFTLDTGGNVVHASGAVQTILGLEPARFQSEFLALLTDHPGNSVLPRAIALVRGGRQYAPVEAEFRSAGGAEIMLSIMLIPVFDGSGHVVAIQGVARDISRRERAEQQVYRAATRDGLTGLLNRRSFLGRLEDAVSLARRHKTGICIGVINLDDFTRLNGEHGHEVGDVLLVQVGGILRATLRSEDSIARSGGDEFWVLMAHVSAEEARFGMERCRAALSAERAQGSGIALSEVRWTAGIASLEDSDGDGSALIGRARALVTRGKVAGGNRIVLEQDPSA